MSSKDSTSGRFPHLKESVVFWCKKRKRTHMIDEIPCNYKCFTTVNSKGLPFIWLFNNFAFNIRLASYV